MRQLHYGRHSLSGSSGAAVATRGWATAIAETGAKVELVVDPRTRRLACPPGLRCTSVRHVGTRRLALPAGLRSRVEASDLLVIHAGLRPHTSFAATIARRLRKPYIVSTHGIYIEGALARRRVMKDVAMVLSERRYLQSASAVHVYFDEERELLVDKGVDVPTIVAPPGVSIPPGNSWDGGSGGYLLWLGRFDPVQKGLDLLLDAFSAIPRSQRLPLVLCGPDWRGFRARVEGDVERRNLTGWVTIRKSVSGSEKWQLLTAAAGFVYPSRYEAFGMSVAEAVGVGVPTLATPFGLSRLLAKHDALLIAAPDPSALADGIVELLSRSERRTAETSSVARDLLSWRRSAASWIQQAGAILPAAAGGERS